MRILPLAVSIFMGVVLFAIPNMTRREILFAVPVPPDFRKSPAARRAILMFRFTVVAVVLTGISALLLSPERLLNSIATAVPIAILLAAGISFYSQNRKLTPAAVQYTRPQEAEMTIAPDKIPWFVWLGIGPFALLAATALWLHFNWSLIALRYAVHFNFAGQPNRWIERSSKGVYGPVIFGAEICAWTLIMAFAGWYGSRRSRSRVVMLVGLIGFGYFFAVMFGLIALAAPLAIPVSVVVLGPLLIILALLSALKTKMTAIKDPMDSTPNECWKGAIVYYNPNDAALFVEKRDGLGSTFNFANPWSWVLLATFAAVIASAPFVLA